MKPDESVATVVPVVAGLIRDSRGRILVSRRRPGTHLEHLWEFPGGKVEPDEGLESALFRELDEELGIVMESSMPLLSVSHRYPDKTIRLWLREVRGYSGTPSGREGQPLMWVAPPALAGLEMPAADRPVTRILEASPVYAISPDPAAFADADRFLDAWRRMLESGCRMVRLRGTPTALTPGLFAECLELARRHGARFIASGDPDAAIDAGADGLHLTARQAAGMKIRPVPDTVLVGVSCHNREELRQAAVIGADFVTLSPVQHTASHADAEPLGWDGFAALVAHSSLPVYALGGITPEHLDRARAAGAYGVAGISGFGPGPMRGER